MPVILFHLLRHQLVLSLSDVWNSEDWRLRSVLVLFSAIVFATCSIPPKNGEGERVDRRKTAGWLRRAFSITQLFLGFVEASMIISSHYHAPFSRLTPPFIESLFLDNGGNPPRLALTPIRILGTISIFIGSFIRLQSMKALGKFFAPQTDMRIQMDHRLITAFPYSVVRHPAYSAILISQYGCLLCSFTKGSWVRESGLLNTNVGAMFFGVYVVALAVFPLVVLWKMLDEDRMMKRQFGKEWEGWARKVKYMAIPGVL